MGTQTRGHVAAGEGTRPPGWRRDTGTPPRGRGTAVTRARGHTRGDKGTRQAGGSRDPSGRRKRPNNGAASLSPSLSPSPAPPRPRGRPRGPPRPGGGTRRGEGTRRIRGTRERSRGTQVTREVTRAPCQAVRAAPHSPAAGPAPAGPKGTRGRGDGDSDVTNAAGSPRGTRESPRQGLPGNGGFAPGGPPGHLESPLVSCHPPGCLAVPFATWVSFCHLVPLIFPPPVDV